MSITFKWGSEFLSENVRGYEVYRALSQDDLYSEQSKVASYPADVRKHTFSEPVYPGKSMFVGVRTIAKGGGHIDSSPYHFNRKDTDASVFGKYVGPQNGDSSLPAVTAEEFPLFNKLDTMLDGKLANMAEYGAAIAGFNRDSARILRSVVDGKEYLFNQGFGMLLNKASYQVYSTIHVSADTAVTAKYNELLDINGAVFEHNGDKYIFRLFTNTPEQAALFTGAFDGNGFPYNVVTGTGDGRRLVYDLVPTSSGSNRYVLAKSTSITKADGAPDAVTNTSIYFNGNFKIFAYFEKM